MEALLKNNIRLAKPGEFTMRAFLNGKLDLTQAEAVSDLIYSDSQAMHKISLNQMRGGFQSELKLLRADLLHFLSMIELELDFSEEDVQRCIDRFHPRIVSYERSVRRTTMP